MKEVIKSVFVAALAILILGMALFVVLESRIVDGEHKIESSSHQNSAATCCAQKPEKSFWEIFFDDPTAFFTGILAIFTIVLAGGTIGLILITQRGIRSQGKDFRESLRISSDAAIASAKAADAAVAATQSERAWLCLEAMNNGVHPTNNADGHVVNNGIISFIVFRNSGRSPAIIIRTRRAFRITNIDDSPNYVFPFEMQDQTTVSSIGPNAAFQSAFFAFSQEQSDKVMTMRFRAIVYFLIFYKTLYSDEVRVTEVCLDVRHLGGRINGVLAFTAAPAGPQNFIS